MKDYKKRAKSGWCGGKAYKNDSNRKERNYEKKEIQEEIRMMEEDYRHTTPKKKIFKDPIKEKIHNLKKKIRHDEKYLRIFSQHGSGGGFDKYIKSSIDRLTHSIKKNKEKLLDLEK